MRRRFVPLLVVLALAAPAAGCGGGNSDPVERLESALDSSLEAALDDEGYGRVRNVECRTDSAPSRLTCTADLPLGPDVFRETYAVTVNPAFDATCWSARQSKLERLTGRDAEALAEPHRLQGCFT